MTYRLPLVAYFTCCTFIIGLLSGIAFKNMFSWEKLPWMHLLNYPKTVLCIQSRLEKLI